MAIVSKHTKGSNLYFPWMIEHSVSLRFKLFVRPSFLRKTTDCYCTDAFFVRNFRTIERYQCLFVLKYKAVHCFPEILPKPVETQFVCVTYFTSPQFTCMSATKTRLNMIINKWKILHHQSWRLLNENLFIKSALNLWYTYVLSTPSSANRTQISSLWLWLYVGKWKFCIFIQIGIIFSESDLNNRGIWMLVWMFKMHRMDYEVTFGSSKKNTVANFIMWFHVFMFYRTAFSAWTDFYQAQHKSTWDAIVIVAATTMNLHFTNSVSVQVSCKFELYKQCRRRIIRNCSKSRRVLFFSSFQCFSFTVCISLILI